MRSSSVALALLVAACASTPKPPPRVAGVKIGKPYQVFGRTYVPADDRGYDAKGVASWYGPTFHGLSTANGERYDQDGLTAAHKTLPMPSFVEVANLDNGRVLTVRINDRGPFVDGRIIDLSRKSAQLLGVDRPGTARVRVRRVYPGAGQVAALVPPPSASLPPPPEAGGGSAIGIPPPLQGEVAPQVTEGVRAATYIQVAALADAGRAAWLAQFLADIGPVTTERLAAGLTRVRLGPFDDAGAQAALARLQAAGYGDARLIKPAGVP